ncbi:MAG: hypothetical protein U0169_14660 [Polyangiaceae bacterium]
MLNRLVMPSTTPPPMPAARPFYVGAALLFAWLFGFSALLDGCSTLRFFRGESIDTSVLVPDLKSDEDRARVQKLADLAIAANDAASKRLIPLAAASAVLGAAMVLLAARGFRGREGARRALVQVVSVHAVVLVVGFAITPDVRRARDAFDMAVVSSKAREVTTDPVAATTIEPTTSRIFKVLPYAGLVLRTTASLLVLVALTRRRAREFFLAQSGVPEV